MADALFSSASVEALLLVRLVAAGVLAGVLGWEREQAGKHAGLRTHMLVGVASALFMVLSEAILLRDATATPDAFRLDLLRVVQAVATGVGFLGAGVIFVRRGQDHVQGLTTAASIWATSAVGLAVGTGLYVLSTGATLLILFVLRALQRFELDVPPDPDL